jgi:hypothetical protein
MPPHIRYRVDPGDVPPEKAALRLGLRLDQFNEMLPRLLARGFPSADPDTGFFDLDAIDAWRRSRHHHLFGGAARGEFGARDASDVVHDRIAALRGGR